jgi:hypothetical protein
MWCYLYNVPCDGVIPYVPCGGVTSNVSCGVIISNVPCDGVIIFNVPCGGIDDEEHDKSTFKFGVSGTLTQGQVRFCLHEKITRTDNPTPNAIELYGYGWIPMSLSA